MKRIQITYQEIKMATRPNVYRNKKKYRRNSKHKNGYGKDQKKRISEIVNRYMRIRRNKFFRKLMFK